MSRTVYQSPWAPGWREKTWEELGKKWDVIVVGGGITGAGILALAARSGLRVLLLEQVDFASGTSSRSSKMVHGGLRYLKRMQIMLTRESVKERQYMLSAAPGLVEPLGFIYPVYEDESPGPWLVGIGLGIYTRLASDAGTYRRLDTVEMGMMAPGLTTRSLERGYHYRDAQTDDARLVLRVLHDGLIAGRGRALALNYTRVTGLVRKKGRVAGVLIQDEDSGKAAEARASLVINATGVWADRLRVDVGGTPKLRPLRGSHLYFGLDKFPVYQAIAFSHPEDGRPVFVYPWEGMALVGTTDVDHELDLDAEPSISASEAEYLLQGIQKRFPDLDLRRQDVISTQAGVRPVVDTGKKDPSAESRDYVLWSEDGLLTVTGGKLTTFRPVAEDALREGRKIAENIPTPKGEIPVFDKVGAEEFPSGISGASARRLYGFYGAAAKEILRADPDLYRFLAGTPYRLAELAWSAENEAIMHLDDLLLRRFRLGILLPEGGKDRLPELKTVLQSKLCWDDARWEDETKRYIRIVQTAHGLPEAWRT